MVVEEQEPMKAGEQVQFACGLEHTWIDGKFTHIRRDGLLQIVSNDHYYHPERADYAYQPPEPASRAEEPHLWAECVAEMPETGGPCGYKPGDYVHKPGAYRYHAFRGAPTSETPGLSEADVPMFVAVYGPPEDHVEFPLFLRDFEAELEQAAAEARRPLEEQVEALTKLVAMYNESAIENLARAERAEAALAEHAARDLGTDWKTLAIEQRDLLTRYQARLAGAEAALRTIMGETHAPTMQLIAKRALASGGDEAEGDGNAE